MPSAVAKDAPVVEWSGDTYRLIPSRFPPVNVYDGLIANDRQDQITAVEDLTNPRLRSLSRLQRSARPNTAADPRLQNWNLAPFAYGNPDGSTFFGEERPCLEVSIERQTALAVSVTKRQTFMEATREAPIGLDMRMLCTRVSGIFWDLRDVVEAHTALTKAQRRQIGARMPSAAQGILYRPTERPAGTCVAIITGDALKQAQQTSHFRYMWDGVRISLLYEFNDKGTLIPAQALAGADDILVAA